MAPRRRGLQSACGGSAVGEGLAWSLHSVGVQGGPLTPAGLEGEYRLD